MRKIILLALAAFVLALANYASAALTPEELSQLDGPKLTVFGAEKAGNADGSIPAFNGGERIPVPSGFDRAKQVFPLPDFIKNEKPIFSINKANVAQYADKLTETTKALINKYPDFRVDVYKSHRTMYIPSKVVEGTKKVAAVAKLENDGKTLNTGGQIGGIPFPLPKNGLEAVWNHVVGWAPVAEHWQHYMGWVVASNGRKIMTTDGESFVNYPYWGAPAPRKDILWRLLDTVQGPANRNGEKLVWMNIMDKTQPDPAWQYLPGQRRVKMAPEVSHDGPNTTVAGAMTYDDNRLFTGSPERFDWKIIGKKEMIVPYNNFKISEYPDPDKTMMDHFVNPDWYRFELHRVYVVEGTLKSNMRHVYGKRTLYIDEDSWLAMAADMYDRTGKLYRGMFSCSHYLPDSEAPGATWNFFGYDFATGVYYVDGWRVGPTLDAKIYPEETFTPQAMAGAGVR